MFKRLDAAALPEDILSNTQTLSTMAHTAGSALWVCADTDSRAELMSVGVWLFIFFCLNNRTRGGFVALSPISPQELFLQPINSDVDPGQEKNLVRRRPGVAMQAFIPQLCAGFLTPSTGCMSCDK